MGNYCKINLQIIASSRTHDNHKHTHRTHSHTQCVPTSPSSGSPSDNSSSKSLNSSSDIFTSKVAITTRKFCLESSAAKNDLNPCTAYSASASASVCTSAMAEVHHLRECFSPLVDTKNAALPGFTERQDYKEARKIAQITLFSKTPLTPSNWRRAALNRDQLKQHVRYGVEPEMRKEMWLGVIGVVDTDSVLFAKAFGEPVDGKTKIIIFYKHCY